MPGFDINPVEVQTAPQQPTALQTVSGLAELQGQLNRNKLFPLQQQGMQLSNQTAQQGLANTWAQNYRTVLSSVPPGSDPADYAAAVARGVGSLYPSDFAASQAGNTDFATLAKQAAIQSGSGSAMEAQFGSPTSTSTGIGTQLGTQNRVTNTYTPAGGPTGGNVPNVAQANAPVYQRFNPDTQQMELVTAGAAAANPAHPAGIPGGAPLGTEAAANVAGAGSANMGLALTNRGAQVPAHKAALDNMRDQVDQFAAGPQSGLWQGVGSFFSQFGLDPSALNKNLGTNAAAAKTEFDKLGLQVLATQAEQAGLSHTDQQNAQAAAASPHATMTPLAIKRMLGVIEGNEDYIKAQNEAWNRWQPVHGAGSFAQFQGAFNSRYDPRVFQSQYLDPEARTTMLGGMSAAQKKTFQARYNDAVSRGLISAGE